MDDLSTASLSSLALGGGSDDGIGGGGVTVMSWGGGGGVNVVAELRRA